MMNSANLILRSTRKLMTSAPLKSVTKQEVHPGYKKIKAQYERFQIDNGVPIHLKGGTLDLVLYYTTLGLCVVGVAGCFDYYYRAAFPKKAC